jgi:copper chaperone CopZ
MMEFAQANVGALLVLGLILVVVAVGLRGGKSSSHAATYHAFSSQGDASEWSISASTGPGTRGSETVPLSALEEDGSAHGIDAAIGLPGPARLGQSESGSEDDVGTLRRTTFPVYRLGCGGGGALTIERALARTPGVRRVYVNPATEMAYLEYNPAQINPSKIVAVIENLGFEAGQPLAV